MVVGHEGGTGNRAVNVAAWCGVGILGGGFYGQWEMIGRRDVGGWERIEKQGFYHMIHGADDNDRTLGLCA